MILKISIALFVIIFFILIWLLFTPMQFYLDTDTAQYEVKQKGTLHASVYYFNEIKFRLKMFGIPINTEAKQRVPRAKVKTQEAKKGIQKSKDAWVAFVRNVANGFSLKQFRLDIDTGDVVLNAKLIPIVYLTRHKGFNITTNFTGRVYAHVELEARLYKFVWAYLKLVTTNK